MDDEGRSRKLSNSSTLIKTVSNIVQVIADIVIDICEITGSGYGTMHLIEGVEMNMLKTTRRPFLASTTESSLYGGQKGAFKNQIRPYTPESISSDGSCEDKLTRDQTSCINTLGMCAAFFLPITLISSVISFTTIYWFNISPYNIGLFQRCDNWTTICDSVSNFYTDDGYDQMETTWTYGVPLLLGGAGVLGLSMIILVFYPCHRKVNCSKISCAVITGIILLIGFLVYTGGIVLFIMYATKKENDATPGWSFYTACATLGIAFIATLLFWMHLFYLGCFDKD